MMGRHDEAIKQIEMAQKLDPQSSIITAAKGLIHFYARQYPQAIAEYEKVLALDPGFVPAHKIVRWTFQAQNNYHAALTAFHREKSFSGSTDAPGWMVIESQVVSLGGDKQKARELLEKALSFEEVREEPKAFAYEIALAYAALDDREKAIEWLGKSESVGNHGFNFTEVDPRLDKFRSDARFAALVQKLKSPKS
jgi:tetratricopeptide (TPR) repeat protein